MHNLSAKIRLFGDFAKTKRIMAVLVAANTKKYCANRVSHRHYLRSRKFLSWLRIFAQLRSQAVLSDPPSTGPFTPLAINDILARGHVGTASSTV